MLLFAWFLVLAGSVLAGGGSSSSRGGGGASAMRAYTNLHRSLLEPIGLYNARPQIVAPVSPPFRGRNRVADMQNYVRNLYNHDAYIDPESGAGLDRLRSNMMWILNHPNDPRIRDYQPDTPDREMQNALHPVNVRAQHAVPIRALGTKVGSVTSVIQAGSNSNQLTSHLGQADQDRFANAFEVLFSEKQLLSAAERHATSIPRL
ncbi:hypothetical protein PANT_14c00082 [Moesziomyces antarcticus T-34]|uniref:Uncharacterized protein n=1 Tax=Pseudozyma antarctica (strain T-34) TaxID=1151754 RepID=M9LXB0_PSEA3|nr:hypothetical protein PANT_14c00082 [Moesziomyces antarcticus T-34]